MMWIWASFQGIRFPLCQIFSVACMAMQGLLRSEFDFRVPVGHPHPAQREFETTTLPLRLRYYSKRHIISEKILWPGLRLCDPALASPWLEFIWWQSCQSCSE